MLKPIVMLTLARDPYSGTIKLEAAGNYTIPTQLEAGLNKMVQELNGVIRKNAALVVALEKEMMRQQK